ncbi:hypothetical protein C4E44_04345 [Pseudomonas sp. MWU12-2312b]|nr:hypothetical protein C4E44_04345 [Pseudomonas sp. MWU12-2312b]
MRADRYCTTLWRGSLLPLGCEAAPNLQPRFSSCMASTGFTTAAQPGGNKLPRHKSDSDRI